MNILSFSSLHFIGNAGLDLDHVIDVISQIIVFYNGARICVDYAHYQTTLEKALINLQSECKEELIVIFGGNHDPGRRNGIGQVANRLADKIYITEDNPKFEGIVDSRKGQNISHTFGRIQRISFIITIIFSSPRVS